MLTHWSYVFLALTHRCYTSQSIPRSLMTWRPVLGTTSHLWPPGKVAFLKRFHYNHTVTSSINPSTCIHPSMNIPAYISCTTGPSPNHLSHLPTVSSQVEGGKTTIMKKSIEEIVFTSFYIFVIIDPHLLLKQRIDICKDKGGCSWLAVQAFLK